MWIEIEGELYNLDFVYNIMCYDREIDGINKFIIGFFEKDAEDICKFYWNKKEERDMNFKQIRNLLLNIMSSPVPVVRCDKE